MNTKVLIGSIITCCVVVFGLIFWSELTFTQDQLVESSPTHKKMAPTEQTNAQQIETDVSDAFQLEKELESIDLSTTDEGNEELEAEASEL